MPFRNNVVAQDTTKGRENKQHPDFFEQWAGKRTGLPFAMTGIYTSSDGKKIDFDHLQRYTFVFFGFYGCHPCEKELPVLIDFAADYPEADFVYVTFDRKDIREREFKEAGKPNFIPTKNYYILEVPQDSIEARKLTMGYPTKYLLRKDGIVAFARVGSFRGTPADVRNAMRALIQQDGK